MADIRDRLRAADIPRRYWDPPRDLPPGDARGTRWIEAGGRLWATFGTGAVAAVVGNRGTGKSHMVCTALRHAGENGRSILYTTAVGMFLRIREAFRQGAEATERALVDRYARPGVLVIDEAQVRGESAWEDNVLTHIIDRRYAAMLDTVLVSNHRPEELAKSLGPSVADRMRETGVVIVCDWPSFRRDER